jgi:hypothetical protein
MNHEQLEKKSFFLGASQFGISNRLNKRFYVIYNNKKIHFGSKMGIHILIIEIMKREKIGYQDIPRLKIQKENM